MTTTPADDTARRAKEAALEKTRLEWLAAYADAAVAADKAAAEKGKKDQALKVVHGVDLALLWTGPSDTWILLSPLVMVAFYAEGVGALTDIARSPGKRVQKAVDKRDDRLKAAQANQRLRQKDISIAAETHELLIERTQQRHRSRPSLYVPNIDAVTIEGVRANVDWIASVAYDTKTQGREKAEANIEFVLTAFASPKFLGPRQALDEAFGADTIADIKKLAGFKQLRAVTALALVAEQYRTGQPNVLSAVGVGMLAKDLDVLVRRPDALRQLLADRFGFDTTYSDIAAEAEAIDPTTLLKAEMVSNEMAEIIDPGRTDTPQIKSFGQVLSGEFAR